MYGKPKIKGDAHIYHLTSRYHQRLLVWTVFTFIVFVLMAWGFWELNPRFSWSHVQTWIVLIAVSAFLLANLYQMTFGFQLRLDSEGGEFRCKGLRVSFSWQDVQRIDYILEKSGGRKPNYQLGLMLGGNYRVVRDNLRIPYFSLMMPVEVRAGVVPVGILYKWDTLGLNYDPPSKKEMRAFLEHFITTPIGQDLLRYAPHIFRIPKDRFFDIRN